MNIDDYLDAAQSRGWFYSFAEGYVTLYFPDEKKTFRPAKVSFRDDEPDGAFFAFERKKCSSALYQWFFEETVLGNKDGAKECTKYLRELSETADRYFDEMLELHSEFARIYRRHMNEQQLAG